LRNVSSLETIYRDYAPQGVKFYYIYKALAHPETNGYVTPFTLEERLRHVEEARKTLGSQIPWICDGMDNRLKHALGNAPNSEFVIDPAGRIAVKRVWSRPAELRKDLERLVGPVDTPTSVAELEMPQPPRARRPSQGVVPRLAIRGMRPLKIEPQLESDVPFYLKLRAEADADLLGKGRGKLYLGFFLDPLYAVHWNNRAAPLRFEVKTVGEVSVSPASGEGPQVEVEADIDPREFLLNVDKGLGSVALKVTVHYYACDDAQTFCVPVTQHYQVQLVGDPDGGNRRAPPASQAASEPASGNPRELLVRFFDTNRDGSISLDEIEAAPERLRRLDRDGNGRIAREELPGGGRRPGN
jgi:hypothetical protein